MTVAARTDPLAFLWEGVDIGPVHVPNRVGLAPLSTMWVRDGVFTEQHLAYYEERARGGVGLLITEQITADRERFGFTRHTASAFDPRMPAVLRNLAERVHRHGAAQFVQLYGPGILDQIGIDEWGWDPPLSASGIPSAGFGELPEVMSTERIKQTVAYFARAAKVVADAGLDGVELHSARSELLGQFLSPLYNRRSDEYGGSPANRCRLVLEIADAIRSVAPSLAVGLQISVDEYMGPVGLTPDLAAEQLGLLVGAGAFDFVNLSTGNEFTDDVTIPPMEADHIPTEAFGKRAVKIVAGRAVVILTGGVADLTTAARLVREGAADIVTMSRATIADPHLVRKAQRGELSQVTPCLGHNDCLRSVMAQRPLTCLMNPVAGRESAWSGLPAAASAKDVLVVGGGPAGLRAALTAALRGHTVTLHEASDRLGGHFGLLGSLPHRSRWLEAVRWYADELDRLGVDVRLGSQVSPGLPALSDADVVLVATGASWEASGRSPFRPDRLAAPGAELPHVLDVETAGRRALADPSALGRHVILIDETGDDLAGGLTDLLSETGVKVEVITKNPGPFARMAGALDHAELFARLAARDVTVHTGAFLDHITPTEVHVVEMWSRRPLVLGGADSVVLSMLRSPRARLAEQLRDRPGLADRVVLVGDARMPRESRAVVTEAHAIAREL